MPAIPDSLMGRLRHATEQFQQARQLTDGVAQMDTAQRKSMAAALRAAEKELEEVTREIDVFLAAPIPPTPERST